MATIYRGSFVPVISYAAYAWTDHLNSVTIRKIIAAHRCALIRVTKSYRTTSTHALEGLANMQPVEHELPIEKFRYCLRKSLPCSSYGKVYGTTVQNHKSVMEQLKADLTTKWNNTWQTSTLGRTTYDFFPSVNERKTRIWIVLTYHLSQLLTGHGDFNKYLADRKIKDSDQCSCGAQDTSIHSIYHCRNFTRQREIFIKKAITKCYHWPIRSQNLTNKDLFDDFNDFVNNFMT